MLVVLFGDAVVGLVADAVVSVTFEGNIELVVELPLV